MNNNKNDYRADGVKLSAQPMSPNLSIILSLQPESVLFYNVKCWSVGHGTNFSPFSNQWQNYVNKKCEIGLSNMELWTVTKFLSLQENTKGNPSAHVANSEWQVSYSTVKKWYAKFQCGDFKTEYAAIAGRPSTMSPPEIINHGSRYFLLGQAPSYKNLL